MTEVYLQLPSGKVIRTEKPELWKEGKQLPKAKAKARLAADARAALLMAIKPGDTVHTILRYRSRSGMYRRISLVVAPDGGAPFVIDHYVLNLGIGSRPRGNADGIGVRGTGMDMGSHLVSALASALWPDGRTLRHEWL